MRGMTKSRNLKVFIALLVLLSLLVGVSSSVLAGEYEVTDSNTATDPAFVFEDIRATGTSVDFPGPDDYAVSVALPFPFTLYGESYGTAYISTNGFVTFAPSGDSDYTNEPIPDTDTPNAATFALWDDLYLTTEITQVNYTTLGNGTDRRFIVQWTDIGSYAGRHAEIRDKGVTFQIALYESTGRIVMRYTDVYFGDGTGHDAGASATVGIENADGTDGVEYSYDDDVLSDGLGIMFFHHVVLAPPTLTFADAQVGSLTSTSTVTVIPVRVTPGSSPMTTLTLTADG